MDSEVRVHFQLEQDEDDYPPAGVETLWVQPGAIDGEYVIDNIPFFVRDATLEDTIAIREEEGQRWFEHVIRPSGNSLIRVHCAERTSVPWVREQLQTLGCSTEYLEAYNLIAVNIPADVSLRRVQEFLAQQARGDRLDYEEPILRQD